MVPRPSSSARVLVAVSVWPCVGVPLIVTLPVGSVGSTQEVTHGVDTGFLVLNERTYPQLAFAVLRTRTPSVSPSDATFIEEVRQRQAQGRIQSFS